MGFAPGYLLLALTVTLLAPLVALAAAALHSAPASNAVTTALLPYLVVFLPQM